MGVATRKLADGTLVHWVWFTWQGKRKWERSGTVAREAARLDAQRKREVEAGTYQPLEERTSTTVGQWLGSWLERRAGRNARDERRNVQRHVMTRSWFVSMPLNDLRPKHLLRLVTELRASVSEKTGKPLSTKYVGNLYGAIRTSLRDARIAELLTGDPCELPRGTLKRRARGALRTPYTVVEVVALVTSPKVTPERRVFNALALFTGMREGEVCGRRWRDWNRDALPLGSLVVDTQYHDQPLKTEDEKGEHPRKVPVHPELAALLAWWWGSGWEIVYGRKPSGNDWIVPRRKGKAPVVSPHTKSTAYKAWRRSCRDAGVENRSLHSTRHTFISLCRRGGAPKDVVQQITHNASGDIVDEYTTWDWAPLCDAVARFRCDASVDRASQVRGTIVEAPGIEAGAAEEPPSNRREPGRQTAAKSPDDSARGNTGGVNRDARHAAALHRAKERAIAGDRAGCLAEMGRAARLLGVVPRRGVQ